ncbi:MAG: HmuY family protein [Nitrospinota bacterium]
MSCDELTVFAPEGTELTGADPKDPPTSYIDLKSGSALDISDIDAKSNKNWTLAFRRSLVIVNSSTTGGGNIRGGCAIEPSKISRDKFLKLTDDDFKATFNSLKLLPAKLKLREESIDPVICDWRLEQDDKWKLVPNKGWKLKLADGKSFAKVKFNEITDDGKTVVLEYAVQKERSAPFDEVKQIALNIGNAISFKDGKDAPVKDLAWDIKFDKLDGNIYLNSSVNGSGMAEALVSKEYGVNFKSITDASDAFAYFQDQYGSIFRSPRWYRYNVTGKHDIRPNGAVYILLIGKEYYKVQIFDYFEHNGKNIGNFRIRYEKLER